MRFATALVGRVEAARRAPFDWFYQRVVGGLVADLGAERHLLRNVPLILCGGHEIYVFEETPTGCCTAQEHRRPLKVETPVRIRWGPGDEGSVFTPRADGPRGVALQTLC